MGPANVFHEVYRKALEEENLLVGKRGSAEGKVKDAREQVSGFRKSLQLEVADPGKGAIAG